MTGVSIRPRRFNPVHDCERRTMRTYPGWLRLPGLFCWEEVAGILEDEFAIDGSNQFKAIHAGFDPSGAPLYEVFARNHEATSGIRSAPGACSPEVVRKNGRTG